MNSTGYSIKDLEVLSGIKAHTIRIWEKRYNLLSPDRTRTNIRSYNDYHLRRMLNVSFLVRYGYKISKVSKWSDEDVNKAVLAITQSKSSESDYMNRLILHMVNFDDVRLSNLIDEIISDMGVETAITSLFFEFLIKIGVYWQVGSVFPAQEHYVTNLFRQKLIAETDKLEVNEDAPLGLFFLPQHELHELSLLFYNYVALKNDYRTIYLGQNVPMEDLANLAKQLNPAFIFTAFINAVSKDDLKDYLILLKKLFHGRMIYITGLQIQTHQPSSTKNMRVIKTFKDFKNYLKKHRQLQKEGFSA